jgi:uncharacterized protein YegP (UPF0339 family)
VSAREPRIEIVRAAGGWFGRWVAANGRIVWVTPGLLSRRGRVINAIDLLNNDAIELRDVDERSTSQPPPP